MFCNDFVFVSLIVKKKAKTVKQSGCGLASVLKKMGISNIISDDIFRWKQKRSTGMKAWKEKRKITVRRCLLSVGMLLVQYAGRADHYRISEKWKYICVPAFILLMLVFTNDIHQQVFRFPYGFAVQKGIILMDRDII